MSIISVPEVDYRYSLLIVTERFRILDGENVVYLQTCWVIVNHGENKGTHPHTYVNTQCDRTPQLAFFVVIYFYPVLVCMSGWKP